MKKNILLLLTFFISTFVYGQQKIEHPSKLYKDEKGKLYIQKELPVYLYLSTSKDGDAEKVLLESEDSKDYTNPMYFDTEGKNTFHSPWKVDPKTKKYKYPKEDIIFEVYADSKPPYTTVKNKSKGYKSSDKVYFNGSFTLELESNDPLSGVMAVYYSIDGDPFKKYNEPVQLSNEKEYKIQYYAVDNVGNEEETRTINIVIDKTKPKTSVKVNGDRSENVVSGKSEIILEANEEGSGVKTIFYKTNNNELKPYKYPIKTSWFSEGDHSVSYYAVDKVGNQEELQIFEFYVDKTPPMIVEEILGNTFVANGVEYSSGRSKYKITTMDNKAGIKSVHYQIGNGESKEYTEPFYLQGNKGTLNIKTWAYDKVNNKSFGGTSNTKKGASYVDLTGPSLKRRFSGAFFQNRDTIFIAQTTKIILSAYDSESGLDKINYSVDRKNEKQYSEPFTITQDGLHTVTYTGIDKVGNTNQSEFYFVVDNAGPTINADYSVQPIGSKTALDKKIDVYPDHLELFLSATDDLAGLGKIYYKINDGKLYPYVSSIKKFGKGRDYKIFVKVIDRLGNENSKEIEFSIN